MTFWRTLFDRQLKPYKPTYPVTGIDQPVTTTTVSQAPLAFQTLAFSSTSFTHGTPSSGTILNATGGSVIVPAGLPTGLTINSTARTWAWDGSGAAGSGSFTLYENIPGGSGNPNASVISYTIAAGGSAASLDFSLASNSQYVPAIAA